MCMEDLRSLTVAELKTILKRNKEKTSGINSLVHRNVREYLLLY